MTNNCPISFKDYERISTVIISALNDLQPVLAMDCTFIALISKAILQQHHNINATVVSGQANIYLGNGHVLKFGDATLHNIIQTDFHMWNKIDNWLIDFSAPLYREAYHDVGGSQQISRKMMAIQIGESGEHLNSNQLTEFSEDSNQRQEEIDYLENDIHFNYCLQECLNWYKCYPTHLPTSHRCTIPFAKSDIIPILDLKIKES